MFNRMLRLYRYMVSHVFHLAGMPIIPEKQESLASFRIPKKIGVWNSVHHPC